MIVLSSDQAVKDLLDKRSAIYSDRQEAYVGQAILSGGNRLLFLHYGPTWRMLRKMIHELLNIRRSISYVPYQDLENKQMLYELLTQPDGFLDSIRRYATSLTTSMVYGWRIKSLDDPRMVQLFRGVGQFTELIQGVEAALLDCFPLLRWLPDFLSPAKSRARELRRTENPLFVGHWLEVKKAIKQGTAKPSFCVDMAKSQESERFSDDLAAYTAGSVWEAGSDTTSCTLYGFVQAMLLFPDVQRKLQAHLDEIVGEERLPTVDDYPHLPFVRSCIKESLRWMPATILAFPHAVMEEDTYAGFRIPKGATVFNNAYTINMDSRRHPNPRQYNPDRYKDDSASLADSAASPDASKRDQFVFGAGRRICQGMVRRSSCSVWLGACTDRFTARCRTESILGYCSDNVGV